MKRLIFIMLLLAVNMAAFAFTNGHLGKKATIDFINYNFPDCQLSSGSYDDNKEAYTNCKLIGGVDRYDYKIETGENGAIYSMTYSFNEEQLPTLTQMNIVIKNAMSANSGSIIDKEERSGYFYINKEISYGCSMSIAVNYSMKDQYELSYCSLTILYLKIL